MSTPDYGNYLQRPLYATRLNTFNSDKFRRQFSNLEKLWMIMVKSNENNIENRNKCHFMIARSNESKLIIVKSFPKYERQKRQRVYMWRIPDIVFKNRMILNWKLFTKRFNIKTYESVRLLFFPDWYWNNNWVQFEKLNGNFKIFQD